MKKFIYKITMPFRGLGFTKLPVLSSITKAANRYFKSNNPRFVRVGEFGFHLDHLDSLQISLTGAYEPEITTIFKEYLRDDMVFVDIGANIGYHSVFASRLAEKVIAFEADPDNFAILEKNIKENRCSNVEVHNIALSEKSGSVRLYLDPLCHGGHSMAVEPGQYYRDVLADTLDHVLHGERVDFIKMDIEGAEGLALRGMKQTLARWRPIVVTEFRKALVARTGVMEQEFFGIFEQIGYTIKREIGKSTGSGDDVTHNYFLLPPQWKRV